LDNSFKVEVSALYGGQEADPGIDAYGVSICQATSYVFPDTEHALARIK